ncbi:MULTISPECIES: iron-containing alcohol dehydrogenase [unclassified Bifidobacterium]|uniref:iron-containing alcohol dehydrogenase n=1 Tax=unclassified Bifidobacterium TaxID=2608897 RepID=UPI00226A8400|nr:MULTISPECIES: iron-containing alcohol dehydrogenase [unclassified Bifidobacterium]
MQYKLLQRVKVVSTDDLGETLKEILQTESYKRPLVITDHFVSTMPLVVKALDWLRSCGIAVSVYNNVGSDPAEGTVNDAFLAFKQHNADSLIAIGGGSSMDVARGVNIVRTNGGDILNYTDPTRPISPCRGQISVPTTAGTGSEMSNALVVTDESSKTKVTILADPAVSEYAVLNPELTLSLPPAMTIACGLDAFGHAAEGYLSRQSSPVTDAICEKVMYLLYQYLPRAVHEGNDIEARERVMVAANLAGWMLNNTGTIVGHSIAHVLGSRYHIIHGEAVAYALPAVMEFVSPVRPKKIREIGQILGASYPESAPPEQTTVLAVRAFKVFRDNILGMRPFDTYQIDRKELLSNASAVANERFAGNTPRTVDEAAAGDLLEGFGTR